MFSFSSTPSLRQTPGRLCLLALALTVVLPASGVAEDIVVETLDDPILTDSIDDPHSLRWAIREANEDSGESTILISRDIAHDIGIPGEVTFTPTRDLPSIEGITIIEDQSSRERKIFIILANDPKLGDEGFLITNKFQLDGDTTLINTVLQGILVTLGSSVNLEIQSLYGDLEMSTPIDGSGSVQKTGTFKLALAGESSITGTTSVVEGVLRGDTVSLTDTIDIADDSLLVFEMPLHLARFEDDEGFFAPDPVPTGTFTGSTMGGGALVKTSSGDDQDSTRLTLAPGTGESIEHRGGTFVLAGTLEASASVFAPFDPGSGVVPHEILVCGGPEDNTLPLNTGDPDYQCGSEIGTLTFDQSVDESLEAIIQGSGDVRKKGTASLTLGDATSFTDFTGDFHVDEGEVLIGDDLDTFDFIVNDQLGFVGASSLGSSSSDIEVTINSGGILSVDNDGIINAAVTINGGGRVDVINGKVNDPGTAINLVTVNSGGILNVEDDFGDGGVFGDVVVGSGGTLQGTGRVGNNISLKSGGLFRGTGTATGELLASGTVAPTGTEMIQVMGDAVFEPGARFSANVEEDTMGGPDGESNWLQVDQVAQIMELTVDVNFSTSDRFERKQKFSLIAANTLIIDDPNLITVDQATQPLWYESFINTSDTSCTGTVVGTKCLNLFIEIDYKPLGTVATTPNQEAVTFALDAAGQTVCEGTGGLDVFQCDPDEDFSTVYEALGFDTPVPDLPDAFDQMDGAELGSFAEVRNAGASRYNMSISRRFDLEALMSPRIDAADFGLNGSPFGPNNLGNSFTILHSSALAPDAPGMTMSGAILGRHPGRGGFTSWADFIGIFGDLDETIEVGDLDYRVFGPLFGIDYGLTDNLAAGITFGYLRDEFHADHDASKGTGNTYQTGLYLGWISDSGYIAGSARYAYSQMETLRHIEFGADSLIDRWAAGDFDGSEISGFLEGAYTFHFGRSLKLQPVGSLAYNYVAQDGFREVGADSLNLEVNPLWVNFLQTNFGFRLGWIEPAEETFYLHPQLRLSWERDWLTDDRTLAMGLLAVDGVPPYRFDVLGARLPKDRIVVGVSMEAGVSDSFDLFVDYDARVWSGFLENSVALGFRMTF